MRKSGGKLPKRGQALGTSGLGLGQEQPLIRFCERLSQRLGALCLAAAFYYQPVHQHPGQKEKKNSDGQLIEARCSNLIVGARGNQQRAIGRRGQGRPEKRGPGTKINGRSDDGQVVDGMIAAFNAQGAGMLHQQGGEKNFNEYAILAPPLR